MQSQHRQGQESLDHFVDHLKTVRVGGLPSVDLNLTENRMEKSRNDRPSHRGVTGSKYLTWHEKFRVTLLDRLLGERKFLQRISHHDYDSNSSLVYTIGDKGVDPEE